MNKINNIKFSVFIAMSLDGFIAGQKGELDWLEKFNVPDTDYGYQNFFDSIDTIVTGIPLFSDHTEQQAGGC